jgi:MFS transporter, ACDE family, multidrug resistance protein
VVPFTSGMPLVITVVLAGIGIGTVWTNSDTLVSTLAADEQLGASIGAAQSYKEFGDMIGPLLIGAVTQFFGVRVGFVSCGVLALVFLFALARSRSLATTQPTQS